MLWDRNSYIQRSLWAEQVTAAIIVDLAGGAEKLLIDLIWISVFSGRFAAENEIENEFRSVSKLTYAT